MKVTTARLLKLREAGHTIVVSAQPYAGRAVTHAPRSKHDPQPWEHGGFRFGAGELRTIAPSNPPISPAYAANTERANADLSGVVFEGDKPAAVVAATSTAVALATTLRRLRSEDAAV